MVLVPHLVLDRYYLLGDPLVSSFPFYTSITGVNALNTAFTTFFFLLQVDEKLF